MGTGAEIDIRLNEWQFGDGAVPTHLVTLRGGVAYQHDGYRIRRGESCFDHALHLRQSDALQL